MDAFNLAFASFWHFIGALIMLSLVLHYIFAGWNRFWRHWNIRRHGYPPPWCDADGDFRDTNLVNQDMDVLAEWDAKYGKEN